MSIRIACLAAALFLPLCAEAQVRKCIGPDGKVTYSDFICKSETVREQSVRTDANALDHSGLRQEAASMRTNAAVDAAMQSESGQCKFKRFVLGDSLGKELSAAAKKECLDNVAAKVRGAPTSLVAYNRWKEHFSQESVNRNAIIARSEAKASADAIVRSNEETKHSVDKLSRSVKDKSYTCRPNAIGSALDCR